jgi:hypothetical protein
MKDPAVSVNRTVWSPDGTLLGEFPSNYGVLVVSSIFHGLFAGIYRMSRLVVPSD